MKILLHSPVSTVRRNGNRQTSSEWIEILRQAGHKVSAISAYEGERADLLIALHANKSRKSVLQFQEHNPSGKVIVALTGTDIYPDANAEAIDTMRKSDLLITLQKKGVEAVPEDCRDRVVPVIQAARRLTTKQDRPRDTFDICVVGHFRDVKDPLLTAQASRLLPDSSRIRILHAGGILEEKYAALVAEEEKQNPRYIWLGELSETETAHLMASSDLLALTSLSEGGGRVIGEAIVHGTPVLSTRIVGIEGLLDESYPGFFPTRDAAALAQLMQRCESDPAFYATLSEATAKFADQFHPDRERSQLLAAVTRVFPEPIEPESI